MGNSANARLKKYLEQYEVTSRDQKEGIIHLLDRHRDKHSFLKEIFSSMGAQRWSLEALLRNRAQLSHQHILFPKEYLTNDARIDNREPSAWVLYESPGRSMQHERRERTSQGSYFEEGQLWSILASIILAHSFLQSLYIRNESLRSRNIFINQEGSIRILDPLCNQQKTNFRICSQGLQQGEKVYVSPAQRESIRNNKRYPSHNSYKSTVFAAGMIMVELALLRQVNDTDQNEVNGYLSQVASRYGTDLVVFVREMVRFDQSKRMDWAQFAEYAQKDVMGLESRMSRVTEVSHSPTFKLDISLINRDQVGTPNRTRTMEVARGSRFEGNNQFQSQKTSMITINNPFRQKKSAQSFQPTSLRLEPDLSQIHQRSRVTTIRSYNSDPFRSQKTSMVFIKTIGQAVQDRLPSLQVKKPSSQNQHSGNQQIHFFHRQKSPGKKISLRDNKGIRSLKSATDVNKLPNTHQGDKQALQKPTTGSTVQATLQFRQPNYLGNEYKSTQTIYNKAPGKVDQADWRDFALSSSSWVVYTGQTLRGLKHGRGKIVFSDGSIFEGGFRDDMVHGEGKLITKGMVAHGIWEKNKLIQLNSRY